MQAVVMDKAVVGEGALVGARSLVTENTVIPPHTLWMGSPARYRRELTSAEIDRLKKSAENYVNYALQYLSP
jgi:carbonic anhydrase/acetyltransferase-like protein (isoleucine patch superfamily)